ncbi:M-phase phosphoprotein 8-like isoform X2 [Patiria miniata]|uniref:Chromo domain-containing protein n=1 Tax=Patiria miniata TaxID=46514 RepID=A0A914BP59_PATMI|nr:M-phase phosphoprotein 8-like isoform X2 [Patiria miniata]
MVAKMAAEEKAGENSTPESEETIDEDYDFSETEDIYEVEKILGVTKHEGKPLYRVRWQGYGPEEDTWEPRENLLTCEDLVEEFIEKQKQRKQKISQNLAKRDKKQPSKKRTPPKEPSTAAQPKRRRSSEKDTSDDNNEAANGQSKRKSSSSEDEGPPPLKDPFWDNLEKGLITFDGDMYSKVKSRRATLDAKKASQFSESASRDNGQLESKVTPTEEDGEDKDAEEEATPDKAEDIKPSIVKEEPFFGEAGMLPEDMYSKVKSRRAFLDAKKLEAAEEELKQAKKAKKEHRQHRHRHHRQRHRRHHHKKSSKDGPRKPKTLIDLEAIGSLETATQKTLSMSPSVLERETNAANMFHTPDSCLSMEEVLTVAKLEEKTRNGTYGRQLSGQSAEEDSEGDKTKRVLSLKFESTAGTAATTPAVPLTPVTDLSQPQAVQLSPLQSTSHSSPVGHSPTFHPSLDFPPVPPVSTGIIPDTPESPDDSQKGPGPSVWKPWEVNQQCSTSSGSSSSSTSATVSVSSCEMTATEQGMMGMSRPNDTVQDLGQDLADKVSLQSQNIPSPTLKEIPQTIPHNNNNTAKFPDIPLMTSVNTTTSSNAAPTTVFNPLPTVSSAKPFTASPNFDLAKPCEYKIPEPQVLTPVPDKVPAWLELQNFVNRDPRLVGRPLPKTVHEKGSQPPDLVPSNMSQSLGSDSARGVFVGQPCQGSLPGRNANEKQYQGAHMKTDVKTCKDINEKPALHDSGALLLSEPSLSSEIQELLAQACPKQGGIEFDFEEDTSPDEPWVKPGLSPIILSNDALKQAVKDGLTERVREALWLNGSHDLEQHDPICGSTLLMHACMNRHDEIAKLLIANGALVNVLQTKSGLTPLMFATDMGYYNIVAILLEAGAHVNLQQASTGETAMMKASKRGHAQIVNLLLMFGANWAVTSPSANTSLEYAILYKHPDVYDIIGNHINGVVMQFENTINQYLCGTAKLMKPVFPLQCFRIRESTEHHIYLNHDTRQYSHNQGCGNVLFIGHAQIGLNGLMCRLNGHSFVYKVTLNGQDLPQLSQGSNFLLSFLPKNGRNLITVKTICDPYTKMLLLVGAYSLQIMSDGPQIGF